MFSSCDIRASCGSTAISTPTPMSVCGTWRSSLTPVGVAWRLTRKGIRLEALFFASIRSIAASALR